MGSILFIVWRESIEAMLVIGILYAYLANYEQGRQGFRYLWGGVLGGVALSALLALATLRIQNELQDQQLEYFKTAAMFAAAILMTQMVLWMSRHGHKIKKELHADMDKALGAGSLIGVGMIALLAVVREGSETVLYVYSLGLESNSGQMANLFGTVALGFVLALATAWTVYRGMRFLNYRIFFRITGIVLLFSSAGLLISGISNLIGMGALPALVAHLWDTSSLLDSGSRAGGVVASLTGYRSQPSLMLVLAYALYWAFTLVLLKGRRQAGVSLR